jgi:hypothetical protein
MTDTKTDRECAVRHLPLREGMSSVEMYARAIVCIERAVGLPMGATLEMVVMAVEVLVLDVASARKAKSEWEAHCRAIWHTQRKLEAVGRELTENGCDCDCGHHHEEHNGDCERCLACRISDAIA